MTRAYDYVVTTEPRTGTEVVYATHNYSDPTTWFGESGRAVDEVAVDSGDGKTWTLLHSNVIDMVHGKLFDEAQYVIDQQEANPSDPHGYAVIVRVDGVVQTMRAPFATSGGDYQVNYADGSIEFFVSQAGSDVRVDYSYAQGSAFAIAPDPGTVMDIESAKAMWSNDFVMNDAVLFEVMGYAEAFAPQLGLPAGTKIPIQTTKYDTLTQLVAEASVFYPNAVPAVVGARGSSSARHAIEFRYGTVRRLPAAYGVELRVRLADDTPMGGAHASATFYCTVRSEGT